MKKIILSMFCLFSFSFAAEETIGADCLILEDENSIICKYTHLRVASEKEVIFHWIEPNGTVSRKRVMTIPAHHGSVYDYRYIQGRALGTWTFKVLDGEKEYTTNFTLE